MVDLLMHDVRVAKIAPRLIDKTGRFTSPLSGNVRTVTRPGDRWGFQLDYQNLQGIERGRLESLVAAQRGAANRVLYSPGDYVQRGSFPSAEIFPNNNFASGLGTWGTEQNPVTAYDRVIRATRIIFDGTANGQVAPKSPNVTLTQFLPYVIRFFVRQGRGVPNGIFIFNDLSADSLIGANNNTTVWQSLQSAGAFGLLFGVRIPEVTGAYAFGPYNGTVNGLAGDYYDTLWSSCSQCMLVDNGANMLLWSDDFTQAAWSKTRATVTANAVTGPDGNLTADRLTEDSTASSTHSLGQTVTVGSGAADFAFSVAIKANSRTWVVLQLVENTAGTPADAIFNVGGGVVGSLVTGANWSAVRSYMSPLGNGWYNCTLVARKTNAATSLSVNLYLSTADGAGAATYSGDGASNMYFWRATFAQSSVPSRLVQSVGTPVAAIAQTGNALFVKGLPASTNGLLLPGDWIEVNKELKRVTAALNSDASGLGYLQFSPPLRNSPADNDPVIVNTPMGRFVFNVSENGWSSVPPYFASSSYDLVEAL